MRRRERLHHLGRAAQHHVQGTHDELLELGGTYARYYEMQFGRPSEGL